jgi:hypothetical protein
MQTVTSRHGHRDNSCGRRTARYACHGAWTARGLAASTITCVTCLRLKRPGVADDVVVLRGARAHRAVVQLRPPAGVCVVPTEVVAPTSSMLCAPRG